MPNRLPSTLTIGPSNAPRNPPVCRIFFLFLIDVFFKTSLWSSARCRLSVLLCESDKSTFPSKTFLAHSQMQFINSLLQCLSTSDFLARGEQLCSKCRYGAYFFRFSDILLCNRISWKWRFWLPGCLLFGNVHVIVLVVGKKCTPWAYACRLRLVSNRERGMRMMLLLHPDTPLPCASNWLDKSVLPGMQFDFCHARS